MTQLPVVTGRYFDGEGSMAHDARLTRVGETWFLMLAENEKRRAVVVLEISDRLANLPRKVTMQDGATFETEDNDAMDVLSGKTGGFLAVLNRSEKSVKIVAFAVVATVALLFGIFRYGLPAAAAVAAWATPPVAIQAIDRGALQTVDQALFDETNLGEGRQAELTALFEELVEVSGQTEPPLRLLFRDGGRLGANAIALPGGTIILTDQLEALATNEDEIAGVFAHEIGHVKYQHSLKQLYRALGIGFMASVIGGDSGGIVEEVVAQGSVLETLSYSRAFEREADAYSVEIMIKANRDPMGFVDLLDRVYESVGIDNDGETSWFSTHPANVERRELVQSVIDRNR